VPLCLPFISLARLSPFNAKYGIRKVFSMCPCLE
jgi:hypothetical protein